MTAKTSTKFYLKKKTKTHPTSAYSELTYAYKK